MPRWIDADEILPMMERKMDMQDLYLPIHFQEMVIDETPTVDAVQVVRCGECKWWKCADESEIIRYGDCTHPSSAIRKNCLPNETWFCKDGERKEQNDG